MTEEHTIWTRDPRTLARMMLENPAFKDDFHTSPYREYDATLSRRYSHLMSANWAWRQAVRSF